MPEPQQQLKPYQTLWARFKAWLGKEFQPYEKTQDVGQVKLTVVFDDNAELDLVFTGHWWFFNGRVSLLDANFAANQWIQDTKAINVGGGLSLPRHRVHEYKLGPMTPFEAPPAR